MALAQVESTHREMTLDETALDLLSSEPGALIVWLQKPHGQRGFSGFELWTAEAGYVCTVLEVRS